MGNSNLKILVVDDEHGITESISQYLKAVGYDSIPCYTGEEAIEEFKDHKPVVCILDINLPGISGIELLQMIIKINPDTQVIMLTGFGNMESVTESLRLGACDFLQKPVNYEILLHSVNSCFDKVDLIKIREDHQKYLEDQINLKTKQIKDGLFETIRTLGRITHCRDPYTQGHEERVTTLTESIARSMGHNDKTIEGLRVAAILHDVGKISIPAELLTNPTRPSIKEKALLEEHVNAGYEIVKNIPFKNILGVDVAEIIYQHHEKIDGSGYPRGLKENEIMPESQILAVADMVESMSSHRPYRAALPMDVVIQELKKDSGKKICGKCVKVCLEILEENSFCIDKIV